jgi:hypothetical protein
MDYLVLYTDLTRLSPADADAFIADAEALGFDVDDLTPTMSVDPDSVVLISSALGAMLGTILEGAGTSAGERLWALIKRVLPTGSASREPAAIADRSTRITFVFDDPAADAGPVAAREMAALGRTIAAIPDGTVLRWDTTRKTWRAGDGDR